MKTVLLLILSAFCVCAQPFSLGVKVGLPLNDFINTVSSSNPAVTANTDRFIVGPMAEVHLPLGLGIEANALYRRFSYSFTNGLGVSAGSSAWEFPIVAKYRFPTRIVRPYVEAGVAWDHVSGISASFFGSNITVNQNNTVTGAVIGFGAEVKLPVIRISPEIRYTRWTDQHFNVVNILSSNQNQAEFLVGITF